MENSHAQTLSLSNLEEGTYQFKLIVSGGSPPVEGEAFGNVTVLPGTKLFLISALSTLVLGGSKFDLKRGS
jgi:hypothetical protein